MARSGKKGNGERLEEAARLGYSPGLARANCLRLM